jgi:bifunctional non-homologous end joining protein LigD
MLWRSSKPARSRRAPPVEFIVPCQPILSDRAPSGAGWIHEIKHDGYRLVAQKAGPEVRLWSRNATSFTAHFPRIVEAIASLKGDQTTLDGEAVVLHPDGHSDFNALRSSEGARRAVFVAYDLLWLEGKDLRRQSLDDRRAALARLVERAPDILFSEAIEGEGPTIFRHACAMGLEGIVSKRRASIYRSGRSNDWLKTKNPEFIRR